MRVRFPLGWWVAGLCVLLPAAGVQAGTAKLRIKVVDGQGGVVPDVLLVFQMIEDASQQFSVDQDDAGKYEARAQFPDDEATWSVTKVLAPGLLPMKVDLRSLSSGGDVIQEVAGMDLDPAHPIPPVKTVAGGRVELDLTLGEASVVMKRFREARAAAREEAAAVPQAATPSGAHAEAVRLYNEGDFAGAVAAFETALTERPDDAGLKSSYAGALFKAKDYPTFEEVARGLLSSNPADANLLMMVYSSTRARGDMPGALDALLRVKQLGGGKDLVPHLSFVAKKLGSTAAAVPALEAVLDLDPGQRDAAVGLARIHELAGRHDTAQPYLDRAVELDPAGAYDLYFGLAKALLKLPEAGDEQVDRALALLDRAVAIDPDSIDALHELGLAHWRRGNHDRAAPALRKYLTLAPDAEDRDRIAEYLNTLRD